jgi:hypothetical protein
VTTGPWREHLTGETPPRSWAEVAALAERQHRVLFDGLSRVPDLTGSAQLDVCLHARRRLAVHEALEQAVVTSRTGADTHGLGREIRAAELAEATGTEAAVSAAWRRLRAAFVRHVELVEGTGVGALEGELDRRERAEVAEALRLWEGEGDAFLGNEYDVMLGVALQQIVEAAAEA